MKQSLEELTRIVKSQITARRKARANEWPRMTRQDRESETHREKRESEQEIKWEIGKGKGTRRGKTTARS